MSAKGVVKPRVADIIKSGFSNLSEGFKALFGNLREVDVPDDEELAKTIENYNTEHPEDRIEGNSASNMGKVLDLVDEKGDNLAPKDRVISAPKQAGKKDVPVNVGADYGTQEFDDSVKQEPAKKFTAAEKQKFLEQQEREDRQRIRH